MLEQFKCPGSFLDLVAVLHNKLEVFRVHLETQNSCALGYLSVVVKGVKVRCRN